MDCGISISNRSSRKRERDGVPALVISQHVYYASYFCVHSLLCLQGRTITRLQLDKSVQIQIVPVDLRAHEFGITTHHLGRNPHHETPWVRFYEIYDRYAVSHQAYELVARRAYITEPTDESTERNMINYTPFIGFTEIRNLIRHQEFSTLFMEYISQLERRCCTERQRAASLLKHGHEEAKDTVAHAELGGRQRGSD